MLPLFSKPIFGFTAFLNYSSPLLKKINKQILIEINQLLLSKDIKIMYSLSNPTHGIPQTVN